MVVALRNSLLVDFLTLSSSEPEDRLVGDSS